MLIKFSHEIKSLAFDFQTTKQLCLVKQTY